MAKAVSKFSTLQDHILSLDSDRALRSVREWLRERVSLILILVGICFIGLLVMFYWRYQNAAAVESLRRGVVALQNKEFDTAIEHLRDVRRASLGNVQRVVGLLHLGEAYAGIGNETEANKAYEEAIRIIGDNEEEGYLRQILLLKNGIKNEKKGDLERAINQYEKAAELDGPLQIESLASFARAAEQAKDLDKAKANYGKVAGISEMHPLSEVFLEKAGK